MEVYLAYGLVSAVMLMITIIFYSYKNWLALRKNSIYIWLLFFALTAILSDVVVGLYETFFPQWLAVFETVSGVIMSISIMMLYFHLLLYDMAVTRRMRVVRTVWFRVFAWILIATGIISVITPFYLHIDLFSRSGEGARGNMLQISILAIFLLGGVVTLIRNRTDISRREFCVLFGTQLLLLFDVNMQIILGCRNLASYYTITAVLILYYILLHNIDQYRSFSSACFDRDGFNKVLQERAFYKENFACLGICINNVESITNYCTEEEIAKLHSSMGKLLREVCGRHNVYHIHSFEYMIVLKENESAEKKHKMLEEEIPPYFRINGKNIAILCGFYTVEFADAGYDATSLNRTIASMRKLTMEQLNRDSLLNYQGENQIEIQNELEALRVVNACIANKRFNYLLIPIQSAENETEKYYELILQELLRNEVVISQERIWGLATEAGYIREVGKVAFETLCRAIWENKLFEDKTNHFHINLLSSQLANTVLAEEYVQILKSHCLEGERICIELTIDRSVDYDKLTESFAVLKEYGIRLLLDQFGVTVCNLKNVLNMPFDSVKINHHMVKKYCEGKSRQLTYMVHMLRAQGWTIYLDGIDDLSQLDFLEDIEVEYIQGAAVKPDMLKDSTMVEKVLKTEMEAETEGIDLALRGSGSGGVLVHE